MNDLWRVVALVALATLLRAVDLEGGQFRGDEALHLARAAAIARGDVLPAIGFPSTDGYPTPAVFHYLLAAPVRVCGPSPLAVMAVIVALNALAIGGLYRVAAPRLGRAPAACAAALLATSPSVVLAGRKIWNPDLLLPVGVLVLALCWRSRDRRGVDLGLAGVLATVATSLHYSGLALGLVVVWTWLGPGERPRAERLRWVGPWVGVLVSIAISAPFLLAWSRVEAATRASATDPYRGVGATLVELAALLGPARAARLAGDPSGALGHGVGWALLALGITGLVLLARRGPAVWLVVVWAVAGLLPLLLGLVPARPHYLRVLLVPLALGVGACAQRLAPRVTPRALATTAGLAATGLALASLSLLWGLRDRGGAPHAEYGIPLRAKQAAVAHLLDDGLTLARYPALEYLILSDLEGRRRGVEATPWTVPYWEVELRLPTPSPQELGEIVVGAGDPAAPWGPHLIVRGR